MPITLMDLPGVVLESFYNTTELAIHLCQPMNKFAPNEDALAMVQWPSTITILYTYT